LVGFWVASSLFLGDSDASVLVSAPRIWLRAPAWGATDQ
jgi:hypothetical protein